MANAVELIGLEKSFKTAGGVIHAVQGLSLTIPAGQRVALIGPNGAGKSTTIDMLLGLTRPDRGEVRIDGEGPRAAVRNGRIGAMLQNGGLIGDLTVRELLSMIACLFPHSMSVEAAMEIAHVSQHARKRATRLSGGEAQRVRFAIALVSSPSLIVLDEPTAAMDVQGREDFWATMTTLESRGMTALFASHYLAEADMYADRVVVIVAGKIVADGPPSTIKAMAGGRIIHAVVDSREVARFAGMGGVQSASFVDGRLQLDCSDSDLALRELLRVAPEARGIEVAQRGLEEAFLAITSGNSAQAQGALNHNDGSVS